MDTLKQTLGLFCWHSGLAEYQRVRKDLRVHIDVFVNLLSLGFTAVTCWYKWMSFEWTSHISSVWLHLFR